MRTCTQKSRLFPVFFKNMVKSNSQNSQGTAWTTISRGDAEVLDTLISMLIFKKKWSFPDLSASTKPQRKWKLALQKYKFSNSFFKMQLQKCVFPHFNLQILSSKSNLRSSSTNLFNFKFLKTCWKNPKLYKRSLTHFEKMS